jgi:hypothetical protein
MNKPDAADEANEKHRPKNKTLHHFGFIEKGGLLGVKSPGLHTYKKDRQPRKWKPPPAEENQPDVGEMLNKILQK